MVLASSYTQVFDPLGHSFGLSSLIAALPLLTLFVLLGLLRLQAWIAGLVALAVAVAVAVLGYGMPIGQSLIAGSEGAVFGFFPIMWIVINAIWIYNLTVQSGHFDVLRRSFAGVSPDQRIQAIIIAFCFGSLLEALAGFGAPVAICAVMLLALGMSPILAASLALIADTAPVAFGAIGVPITTLSTVTGLPADQLGSMVGRQTPVLALFVPFVLVGVVGGIRGVREVWPAALTAGLTFAVFQFLTSTSSPSRSPTSWPRSPPPARSCCCCASGSPARPCWPRARPAAAARACRSSPVGPSTTRRSYAATPGTCGTAGRTSRAPTRRT